MDTVVDQDRIKELYYDESNSVAQVARIVGLSPSSLTRKMKAWGMELRSRGPKGASVHTAKLTEDDVRWIRANPDMTPSKVLGELEAKGISISRQALHQLRQGKTWRSVK